MKLFVSHSTKTDGARALFRAIGERLKGIRDVELLWDPDLSPGHRWRAGGLDRWLAECDGAVILFSKDALASGWVLKEAQILTWRKALSPRFVLVPVVLAPVTRPGTNMDQWAKEWSAVKVDEIQFLRGADPQGMDAAARAALAERVAAAVEKRRGPAAPAIDDDPVRVWVDNLADDLREVGVERLVRAGRALGIERDGSADDAERWARVVAYRLLSFGTEPRLALDPAQESFECAADAFRAAVRTLAQEARTRAARQFFPVWVSPDAARHLPAVSRRPPEGCPRLVCINGTDPEAGRHYADRATCGQASERRAVTWAKDVHAGDREQIVEEYDRKLAEYFGLEFAPEAERAGDLESIVRSKGAAFVVLYGEACHGEVLRRLWTRYPPFTFIAMVGARDPVELGLQACRLLEPSLRPGRDRAVLRLYSEIVDV